MRFSCLVVALLPCLVFTGCAPTPAQESHNGGLIHQRNEGYSLIHALLGDESQVSQLLVIKHIDEPLNGLIKQISASAKAAQAQLEQLAGPGSLIDFQVSDLPKPEADARELERKRQTGKLLFASRPTLALRLVYTQAEATGYLANLCQATSALESDPTRRNFLNQTANQFAGFRDQLMGMLGVSVK